MVPPAATASIDIRPVELADDELMSSLEAVARRSALVGRPWVPLISAEAWVAMHRARDVGERLVLLAAHGADDRVLGVATIWLPLLDNTDKVYAEIAVDPDLRRHGVGSALVEALLDLTRTEDRHEILVEVALPIDPAGHAEHPYQLFAAGHGFVPASIEVVRHQQLPIPDTDLDAWSAPAAERSVGYTVETFVGPVPVDLVDSLCVLLGQLAVDAPTGDVVFEEEVFTRERFAERYATADAMDYEIVESLALAPDRTVAAQSTLFVPRHDTTARQWGTFVHREHRGHRLGLLVKTANLRAVQQRWPAVDVVTTQNHETNRWMIDVNEQMGYHPMEAAVEMMRRL